MRAEGDTRKKGSEGEITRGLEGVNGREGIE